MDPQKNNQVKINNAHDLFFRESLQDIEIARDLALLTVPLPIQKQIDWKTLEIVNKIWVDENLKEHRSDAIYRAKLLEDDQWVYLLFEHKSTLDKRVQIQLLRYIVEIWEQHEKQKWPGKLLPLVIPIVVCHCNRICIFNNSVKEMVAIIKGIEDVVPDFSFFKLDLWLFEPDKIKDGKLKIFLMALKYSRSPEVLSALRQIIRKVEEVKEVKKEDYNYLDVVLLYLGSVIEESLYEQYCRIIALEHSGGEKYMGTIADKLRREERLKREKAERIATELRKEIEQKDSEMEKKEEQLEKKDEQLYQMVKRMLEKGLDFQFIREITGLSIEKIEQIKKSIES